MVWAGYEDEEASSEQNIFNFVVREMTGNWTQVVKVNAVCYLPYIGPNPGPDGLDPCLWPIIPVTPRLRAS